MATLKIEISDLDEKILKHEIEDIKSWMQLTLSGRAHAIKGALLKEAVQSFFNDESVENIPASLEGCLELYFSKPYYKNMKERQKQQIEQMLADGGSAR